MNTTVSAAYKPRTSDEALAEHLKLQQQKLTTASAAIKSNRKQMTAPMPPTPPPEPMRIRSDSTATSIYVIGGIPNGIQHYCKTGITGIGSDDDISNPATLERKHHNRLSWVNMRRKGEETTVTGTTTVVAVTPSPQTTRSYMSTVDGGGGGGGVGGGGVGTGIASGRTTAASGRISTSGVSSSNNTLNDIVSDYHSHEGGTGSSSDYHYSGAGAMSPTKNLSSNGSFNMTNGSTVKLLPPADDEANQQTKCSVFRGLVLCICLNVTYANVVRFPRELDRYGLSYLIPYIILLFLVGLPITLLEISVGQFLGQGAAHTWRASPIFKGACIISRFASWLATIWVSLQAVVAVAYIGMFLFNTLPFRECVGNLKLALNGYTVTGNSGQECLQKTFLTPFWENPMYFGLLSIGLIGIWIVVMLCTHNGRFLRRSLFFFGIVGFVLLCSLTGLEVHNSFSRSYFPELWPFEASLLLDSNIWFNALMQVIFATNCGFGVLPMITGKFLYKGDAVRTSIVYLCFNLLINAISVTLFMVQFDLSANSGTMIDELKPLTAIYDRVLYDKPHSEILARLIPILLYLLIVISSLISITVAIYTSTRLVPRHPNYVIGLIALVMSIISLSAPKFIIARILDTRVIGTMVITALVFDLIAITWIYGVKNIYTDLEFSIGRPIFKGWMCLWCICPAILTGLLVWWCSDDDQFDLLADYMPRWAPILFVLGVIFIIACIQIFRQVEYNFFGMICEASKSAKEWGPADPLARHAWKQWRSVCQDTGRRDFTLRRRGTRDYTHSIKKGQYSTSNNTTKYAANGNAITQQQHHNAWKSSTPGNSSPNYSGSMFGDSAIEEDISVDKFPGVSQQFVPFQTNASDNGKPLRYSHHAATRNNNAQPQQQQQRGSVAQPQHSHQHAYPNSHQHQHQQNHNHIERPQQIVEKHREVVYIRRLSDDGGQHATRIEITPSNESITYAGARNPLGRSSGGGSNVKRSSSSSAVEQFNRHSVISVGGAKLPPPTVNGSADHICWRKFTVNAQEYSTEL